MKIKVEETSGSIKYKEIVIRKPIANDVLAAQMLVGETNQMEIFLALMAICGTFDGEKKTYEELRKMDGWDFFDVLTAISPDVDKLVKQLSTSPNAGASR